MSISHAPVDTTMSKYLFIDGSYLYKEFEKHKIGTYPEFVRHIENQLTRKNYYVYSKTLIRRIYYYDCLDETNENDGRDYASILKKMSEYPGHHIRKGVLKGNGKRQRQKQVDVQLAVDMLNHAFQRNMDMAFLITGDLDFKPVIESCKHLGVYVVLCASRSSVAEELVESSDHFEELEKLVPQT